jgi:hypothetical protein
MPAAASCASGCQAKTKSKQKKKGDEESSVKMKIQCGVCEYTVAFLINKIQKMFSFVVFINNISNM